MTDWHTNGTKVFPQFEVGLTFLSVALVSRFLESRFIIIFERGRTAENPVTSSFDHTSLVLNGVQLIIINIVPVSVDF